MNKLADITLHNDTLLVTGDLHFSNVMSVYENGAQLSKQCSQLTFDFSQVKSSDSSGLALIIEWIKLSKQQNKPIKFLNLSHDIMSIAKAAGLDGLFNGKTSGNSCA